MMRENQDTVFSWIHESFPSATMRRRLKHLFEEVTELALDADPDLPLDDILSVVSHAFAKACLKSADQRDAAAEVGDVRVSLIGVASALGVSEQDALDRVMRANRERSLDDRRAREQAKQGISVFKS